MLSMNTLHAPNKCDGRAKRIAQVKFVVLEMDPDLELTPDAQAVTPAQAGARSLSSFRSFLIRVIGRLEAARP
jgi:hypothetical protein